jgi:short-subunit dehydrogenase
MQIPGRTVLLTGASGGIGHAIARRLSSDGARLVLTGRRRDALEALAAELGAEPRPADLTDRRALHELGGLDADCFVSNAALPGSGALDEYTLEELDRVLDVNLRAPVVLARLLVARMRAKGEGHLLFVTSVSARMPSAWASLYCATKFGLRGFALSLRQELRGTGIGVSLVLPGMVRDAGMFAEAGVEPPRGAGTSSPEEVATAVSRAIQIGPAQLTVAPLAVRLNMELASAAPGLAGAIGARLGADQFMAALARGQRHKR